MTKRRRRGSHRFYPCQLKGSLCREFSRPPSLSTCTETLESVCLPSLKDSLIPLTREGDETARLSRDTPSSADTAPNIAGVPVAFINSKEADNLGGVEL